MEKIGNPVEYNPDLAHILRNTNYFLEIKSTKFTIDTCRKTVGFFLMRTVFDKNNVERYNQFISALAQFIDKLSVNFNIILFAFNTNNRSKDSNDLVINEDIYNKLTNYKNVLNVTDTLHIEEMLYLIKTYVNYCVCMKYHSHILSIMAEKPILSINSLRKTRCLMNEISLNDYVLEFFSETKMNSDKLYRKFMAMVDFEDTIKDIMAKYNKETDLKTSLFIDKLNKLINDPMVSKLSMGPDKTIKNIILYILDSIFKYFNNKYRVTNPSEICNDILNDKYTLNEFVQKFLFSPEYTKISTDLEFSKKISSDVLFMITGKHDTKYEYGLQQKLFQDISLNDNLKWIFDDVVKSGHFIYKNDQNYCVLEIIRSIMMTILENIEKNPDIDQISLDIYNDIYTINSFLKKVATNEEYIKITTNTDLTKKICSDALFMITWSLDTVYEYGFCQKLYQDISIKNNLLWIIEDFNKICKN